MLLSSSSAASSFQSTFSLEDIQQVVSSHPSDDLLEGLLLSILQSSFPSSPSSATPSSFCKLLSHSDSRGRQLLHVCTALGFVHVVAFLLDASLHIDTPDEAGRTPLHYAAQWGDEETVAAVLAFGADVELRDDAGKRPVDVAKELGRKRIVEVLEEVEEVEEEERREPLYSWEEEAEEEEDDVTAGSFAVEEKADVSGPRPVELRLSPASQPRSTLPYTAALTPSHSFHSLSMPTSPSNAAPLPSLDVAFARLTLSDMGINTTALHSSLVHPTSPSQFHSLVRDTQRQLRWWLYRRHYAALKLQAAARGMLVRRSMKRMRESAVVIQRVVRRRRERAKAMGSGRFQGVVEELQERVRRKREAMEERSSALTLEQHADLTGELDPFATDASHAQMMPLSPISTAPLE